MIWDRYKLLVVPACIAFWVVVGWVFALLTSISSPFVLMGSASRLPRR